MLFRFISLNTIFTHFIFIWFFVWFNAEKRREKIVFASFMDEKTKRKTETEHTMIIYYLRSCFLFFRLSKPNKKFIHFPFFDVRWMNPKDKFFISIDLIDE